MHLPRIFFSRQIQPLQSWMTKMWTYLGPSCPDRPSFKELSAVVVEAQIHKVLDFGVTPTLSVGPNPVQRGIASVRVSYLGPISTTFVILSFHYASDLAQGLGGGCDESWDADPPADAMGWEARHASSGDMQACEERKRDQCATRWEVRHASSGDTRVREERVRSACCQSGSKKAGGESPPRSASSSEGEMGRGGGGATLPLLASQCVAPFLPRDRDPLPIESLVDERQLKRL
jgi:hypothetical protein